MTNSCVTRWLTLLCNMIPGIRTANYVTSGSADGELAILATLPQAALAGPELLALLQTALANPPQTHEDFLPVADDQDLWLLVQPLPDNARRSVVALEITGIAREQRPAIRELVSWASQWSTLLTPEPGIHGAVGPDAGLFTALLDAPTLNQALSLAARSMAQRFDCQRVVVGVEKKRSIELASVSDRASFDARTQSAQLYTVAMNESFDQSQPISYPPAISASDPIDVAHGQLARTDRVSLCSMPLGAASRSVGIVTLVRDENRPFAGTDVEQIAPYAKLLGRVIATRRRADQGVAARLSQTVRRWFEQWLLAGSLGRRVAVGAVVAALTVACLGTTTYKVSATAVLAGVSERTLASPVDGYLSEVHVRAGARVARGELLASLDPKPIERQRRQLEGQRNQLSSEYNVALGNLDGASARILQSQLAQTSVQIEHLDEQLARLNIEAPFDGLILDGDLMHATGSPVTLGEPLFRLTPEDGYVVRLHVDEADVGALGIGARGQLKLAALPNAALDLEVVRINGIAQSIDGRSVLEMEALVSGDQNYLRPGMKGVARLSAGRAGILWVWTHSIVQRLQLWFWRFSPVV